MAYKYNPFTGTLDQVTTFQSGTEALPGIYLGSDNDTGIYSPGADQIAITTAGSERLRIDSSGNVGIGTTSPAYALDCSSGGETAIRIDSAAGSNAILRFSQAGTNKAFVNYQNGGGLTFGPAGIERARIDSSGNVGIGTSLPRGTIHIGADLQNGATDAAAINLKQTSTTAPAGIYLERSSERRGYYIYLGGDHDSLNFQRNNAGTKADVMTLTRDGIVGIGTTSPGVRCEIKGSNAVEPNSISNFLTYGAFRVQTSSSADTKSFAIAGGPSGLVSLQNVNDSSTAGPLAINPFGGNVGIGTTSPSTQLSVVASSANGIELGQDASLSTDSSRLFFSTSAGSNALQSSSGSLRFFTGSTAGSSTGTERLRIDSSGRLLIGTSSSRSGGLLQVETTGSGSSRIHNLVNNANDSTSPILKFTKTRGTTVGAVTAVQNDDALGYISFSGTDGTNVVDGAYISAIVDGTPGTNDLPTRLAFSTTADGASSPTERMRIDNSGNHFAFGSTSCVLARVSGTGTSGWIYWGAYGATSTTTGTQSFGVYANGNVLNTNNSYGALSDIKLKENIVDASSQWSDIKALQVRNYNLKEGQTHTQIGLIAQEVEPISPGVVYESPDRDAEGNDLGTVTKSVNYSVLYMKAVKALQEAMERIEILEQRLTDAGL